MLFRRHRVSELESAHRALAEGRYEAALAVLQNALQSAARRPAGRASQGQYWLQLAALYALYGEDGLENGQPALRSAIAAEPTLAASHLYQALFWEFAAYKGGSVGDVKRGLKDLPDDADPVAAYHAASALFAVDAPKSSARRLAGIPEGALPTHLDWRRWSLLGQCREAMSEWEDAAAAFARAVVLAPEAERGPERLSHAGALIELGATDEALAVLAEVDEAPLHEDELAVHRYLLGRAHLELGNPNQALALLTEAAACTVDADGPGRREADYSVVFATAQALAALGRQQEAMLAFERALAASPVEHRAYTQHEAAYAAIECDRLAQAEELLTDVVSDPSYPHRADALADLADVKLRGGEYEQAQTVAEQALELGATAPACLTLGSVAFEYFALDEAASWFEQVVSASHPGDPLWTSAHQMLADVYAQKGDEYVSRVLIHAKAALDFTPPGSEWYLPLARLVEGAKTRLGGFDRPLN